MDIGGIEVVATGSRLLTAEDVAELTGHINHLQDENVKLREMVRSVLVLRHDPVYKWLDAATEEVCGKSFTEQACDLGIEAEE